MRSITLEQAALIAALAMLLLTGYQLIDNARLLETSPVLVVLGSTVPSLIWAAFFFAVYWRPSSAKTVTWITLVFAVLLEAVVVYVRFHQSVNYWTPFGDALSLSGWLLRFGWAVFLIAFALAPEHAPDKRTRQVALILAIVSAPSALSTTFDAWNSWLGFLLDDIPRQAFWRVLITPAIRTIYWLSQILFLWTTWDKPEMRDSIEASATRLTP